MNDLSREDRHAIHNARVIELIAGEISGKHFVHSLVHQVGLTDTEAKFEYSALYAAGIAISNVRVGNEVFYNSSGDFSTWQRGRVTSLYGLSLGVIVDVGSALKLPFSLYEVRCK